MGNWPLDAWNREKETGRWVDGDRGGMKPGKRRPILAYFTTFWLPKWGSFGQWAVKWVFGGGKNLTDGGMFTIFGARFL
jgi:hypothetical protein